MTENPYAGPDVVNDSQPRSLLSTLVKVFVAIGIVLVLAALLLLPAVSRRGAVREVARRTQCENNLKQIGLALHNYADVHGAFPPAYTVDDDGQPLHSWRTLILPYLDQQALYDTIDLTKPWNDPVNAEVLEMQVPDYQCPSANVLPNHSSYVAIVGPTSCFQPTTPRPLSDITDGTGNTLIVIEVPARDSVPWMEPRDVDEDYVMKIHADDELSHTGGFQGLLADGSVRFLAVPQLSAEQRQAMISAAAGDDVGDF